MNTLEELVSIGSYDTKNNKKIIEYLVKNFQNAKEIIRIKDKFEEKENLIIGLNTRVRDCDCILLSGHIDTVDLGKTDTRPTIIGNKMFGLGVIDMKCFFATILDNLDRLKSSSYPIIIAITCDEETRLNGIGQVIAKLKSRNVRPKFAILGEPTDLKVCTSSKSCYEYEVSILGKSAHSSNPKNGINAIYIGAKLSQFIENLCEKYESTTLSVGKILGGEAANIVPKECKVTFDLRTIKYADQVISDIKNFLDELKYEYPKCKIDIKMKLSIPPTIPSNSEIIDKITKTYKLECAEFKAGCEAGYIETLGSEVIIFGAGKLSLAHNKNENLNLNRYKLYNKKFLKILDICEEYYR